MYCLHFLCMIITESQKKNQPTQHYQTYLNWTEWNRIQTQFPILLCSEIYQNIVLVFPMCLCNNKNANTTDVITYFGYLHHRNFQPKIFRIWYLFIDSSLVNRFKYIFFVCVICLSLCIIILYIGRRKTTKIINIYFTRRTHAHTTLLSITNQNAWKK